MTQRITEQNLQAIVARINRMTNSPAEPWSKDAAGRHVSNIGCFHLDHAYGGVALHRMANTAGAVNDVLRIGHVSKRELQGALFAYIEGIYAGQELAKVAA